MHPCTTSILVGEIKYFILNWHIIQQYVQIKYIYIIPTMFNVLTASKVKSLGILQLVFFSDTD